MLRRQTRDNWRFKGQYSWNTFPKVFARNLLRENRQRNNFRILFWRLGWCSNPGFSSNKPTQYLLDHGDYAPISRSNSLETRRIVGKINHGFFTTITHQFTHRCLCVSFLPKTNYIITVIMPQKPYSPDLARADFFLFLKLKSTDESKACFRDWGDKRKIKTGAVGDTKKRFSVFRGLEKMLA